MYCSGIMVNSDNLSLDQLYWEHNYGHCDLGIRCKCLRSEWLGVLCENWNPLGVKSFEEYQKYIIETHKTSSSKSISLK